MTNHRSRKRSVGAEPKGRATSKSATSALPPASTLSDGDGEVTVFLSYAREDDSVYDMVHPFKKMLGHFIYAKSGRRIKSFLDQDSIEWGEIWRDRLDAEILGASVFIPLLSAAYLDSDACRMEFNKFQSNANALGVKELLLPVLLINAPAIFNEYSTDDIVRDSAARQWEVIEEAVLSDSKSAAWKTTMARLADRFVKAYETAEAKLADVPGEDGSNSANLEVQESAEDDDDEPGIAEISASLEEGLSELTEVSREMSPAIQALGEAAKAAGPLQNNPTSQQVQAWSLAAARAFSAPSEKLSEYGERMFITTKRLDLDMQRLRRLAVSFLHITPELAINYNKSVSQLSGLDVVEGQLNGLLDKMKPAESFSVPLRKSLRPARRGLTRVTDSLRLIETWQEIDIL